MIKWYLVLWLFNGGMVNIPEPYNSETECHNVGSGFNGIKHICVKSPATPYKGCIITATDPFTGNMVTKNIECLFDSGPPKKLFNPTTKDKGYVCQPGDSICQTVK